MLWILFGLFAVVASVVLLALGIKALVSIKSPEDIAESYKDSPESKSVFIKKYPPADIRTYSGIFMRVGLICALGVSILAFTWTTYDRTTNDLGQMMEEEDFEIEPPQTQQKPPPPPPPPPPEIEIVEDEEVLEEEPEIEDIEVEENEIVEAPEAPPEPEALAEPDFFTIVEDMPRFPGCENKGSKKEKQECADLELRKYLAQVKYPQMAKENDIQGKVYVRFIVEKDGSISNAEIARGADRILNDAALKHVQTMPKWIPGKQRGKAVRVQYSVPFNFKLRN